MTEIVAFVLPDPVEEEQQPTKGQVNRPESSGSLGNESSGTGESKEDVTEPPEAPPAEKKKKKFQMQQTTPKCGLCQKSVYKTEEVLDSKDKRFHNTCLRCHICKAKLQGKEPVADREILKLSNSQYRVLVNEEDGSMKLYCSIHGMLSKGTIIAGTLPDAQKDSRLKEKEVLENSGVMEKNKEIKEEMEMMMDGGPVCGKCGGPLDSSSKVVVNGLERYHEICPDLDDVDRTPKYFVKKCQTRPVASLLCDGADTKPLSFIFELDEASKKEALKKKKGEISMLLIKPDEQSRNGTMRKLTNMGDPIFQLTLKHEGDLTNEDPSGEVHEPKLGLCLKTKVKRVGGKAGTLSLFHNKRISFKIGSKEVTWEIDPSITNVGGGSSKQIQLVGLLNNKDEQVDVSFELEFEFQAFTWKLMLEEVLNAANDDNKFETVTICKFKLSNGVLRQFLYNFLFSEAEKKIGSKNSFMVLSSFPEKANDISVDPLKDLKENLKEKREIAAAAEVALHEEPKPPGGCCVIS